MVNSPLSRNKHPTENTMTNHLLNFKTGARVQVQCEWDGRHEMTGTVVRPDPKAGGFWWVRFKDGTQGNYHETEIAEVSK